MKPVFVMTDHPEPVGVARVFMGNDQVSVLRRPGGGMKPDDLERAVQSTLDEYDQPLALVMDELDRPRAIMIAGPVEIEVAHLPSAASGEVAASVARVNLIPIVAHLDGDTLLRFLSPTQFPDVVQQVLHDALSLGPADQIFCADTQIAALFPSISLLRDWSPDWNALLIKGLEHIDSARPVASITQPDLFGGIG